MVQFFFYSVVHKLQNHSKAPARATGYPTWAIPGLDILSASVDYPSTRILEIWSKNQLGLLEQLRKHVRHGALIWQSYYHCNDTFRKPIIHNTGYMCSTLVLFLPAMLQACNPVQGITTAGAPRHHGSGQPAIMRAAENLRIHVARCSGLRSLDHRKINIYVSVEEKLLWNMYSFIINNDDIRSRSPISKKVESRHDEVRALH